MIVPQGSWREQFSCLSLAILSDDECPCNNRLAGTEVLRQGAHQQEGLAARRLREMEALGYEAVVLPSTSPANAGMRFEEKLAHWRAALLG